MEGEDARRRRQNTTTQRHRYNVDEMLDALEGARRVVRQWFAPYPRKRLRPVEFAGWPTYAQARRATSFSEGIGFLTRSKPDANAAFWIAAHRVHPHMW